MDDRSKAIAAYRAGVLDQRIVFQTGADFTPSGKRNARIVQTSSGGRQLRLYVSGRLYRYLAPTAANISMAKKWMSACA